jgi:hypothetical protein
VQNNASESTPPAPSPDTQGEDGGEGTSHDRTVIRNSEYPLPNPLPEYKEREKSAFFGDLTSPIALYLKAILLLAAGLIAATILLLENPTWRTAALLALCVWCFCRAYYFAFYVIERYVDPRFRYAGLFALARYVLRGDAKRDKVNANLPSDDVRP